MVALLAEFGDDGKVIAGGQSVRGSGRYRDPPLGELPGHIRASGRGPVRVVRRSEQFAAALAANKWQIRKS